MYGVEKIISFFKQHPKYPFDNYYAARLMTLNIVKEYIPENEIENWTYTSDYYDARRKDPEVFYSLLSCINHVKEQVFFFAIVDNREDFEQYTDVTINVERDDFYGEKWRDNSPVDEWYSIFQITLNLNNLVEHKNIDHLLNQYFNQHLSFDELYILQENHMNIDDE